MDERSIVADNIQIWKFIQPLIDWRSRIALGSELVDEDGGIDANHRGSSTAQSTFLRRSSKARSITRISEFVGGEVPQISAASTRACPQVVARLSVNRRSMALVNDSEGRLERESRS